MRVRAGAMAAAFATALTGCAAEPAPGALIADPYERLNRDVAEFNRGWDQVLLRPASQLYDAATPELFKFLIRNVDNHLRLPVYIGNHLLQGELESAGAMTARLVANTALGGFGLLDPATEMGLPIERTDFGETMFSYGVDEGPFVMIPFFGPSTMRDAWGRGADFVADPFNFLSVPGGPVVAAGRAGLPIVDARASNAELIDSLLYDSPDSYVALRSGWVQARRRQLAGEADVEALPDIFADEE